VVNIRARFSASVPKPGLPNLRIGGSSPERAIVATTAVLFSGRKYSTATYDRTKLQAGNRIPGPAIVTEYSATTAIPPLWTARVDSFGNLILEPRP
jgi:N-methylhydantoinase A